ncbi:MAG: tRNA (adenosine(37)-N6)-threonylcarbamoyltransferase complex dimerization subunit type 1 TsaB [Deltaproteobacteria bacterium]|nr:tRNA (adenosine(37)-N6)-threonylcarbamoyltransferase complex dimerization subunit type 1 TsaB [Deltaproteobacteria bacterium]
MKILGLDTATLCGSIGIIDDDKVVAEYALHREETLSARLLPAIQTLLAEARLDLHEIDGIAVSLGPGSFTGLRVGLSAVKGLALATQKPAAGIPTLDALAYNLPFTPYQICPLLDARKGQIYTALYKNRAGGFLEQVTPYQVLSPAALIEAIPHEETVFLGDGVKVCQELITQRLAAKALFAPLHLGFLRGTTVAELGLKRLGRGESDDISALVPIYVRPSDAELKGGHGK